MNKPDVIILGMPRSGTSLVANILSDMGVDLYNGNESIDDMYLKKFNKNGYYQRKDIHLFIKKSNAYHFNEKLVKKKDVIDDFNLILKNTKKSNKPYIGFKEPYLLYILPIIKIKPLIIIVIRNIKDVINSCNKFLNYKEILHPKVWINYYSYFMEQNFDYICINYDKLMINPKETYNKFYLDLKKRLPKINKIKIDLYILYKNSKYYK